jgi:hypothetical protein
VDWKQSIWLYKWSGMERKHVALYMKWINRKQVVLHMKWTENRAHFYVRKGMQTASNVLCRLFARQIMGQNVSEPCNWVHFMSLPELCFKSSGNAFSVSWTWGPNAPDRFATPSHPTPS